MNVEPGDAVRLTLHLLRRVSWPHLRAHRLRTVLTLAGIALGVATVVAVADVSDWLLASFEHTVQSVVGDGQLEVSGVTGPIPDALAAKLAEVPGVDAAAGLIEAFVPLADEPEQSLYLLGVDFLASPVWRKQLPRQAIDIPDEMEFVSRADSVVVPRNLASARGWRLGDEVRVLAPDGPRSLRLRGLVDDVPLTRLFGGAVAVMDLPAAELLLGRGEMADRIVIAVAPGHAVDDIRRALAAIAGDGAVVQVPEERGVQTEQLLYSLRTMILTSSLLAVVVAALVVYHTVAASVHQRRRELALLHLAGVPGRTAATTCLIETLLLGVIGSAAGLAGGRLLASVVGWAAAGAANDIWLRLDPGSSKASWWAAGAGAVVGTTMAVSTGAVAVYNTFRMPTLEALRPGGVEGGEQVHAGVRLLLAGALILGSLSIFAVPVGIGFAATVALVDGVSAAGLLSAAVIAPFLVVAGGGVARRVARGSRWVAARLAVDDLPRRPGRSGATVATIAIALGISLTLAVMVESMQAAWVAWIEQHFAADLLVGGGGRVHLLSGPPLAPEVAVRLGAVAGVAAVEPFRVLRIRVEDRPVSLEGIAIDERLRRGGLPMVEGSLEAAAPALRAGTGVLLSDNLALRLRLHRGDEITVPTPGGPRRFRIEGTFVDYLGALDLGSIAVDWDQLGRIWDDHFATTLRVWLLPGADAGQASRAVRASLGPGSGLYVLTAREFVDGIRGVLRQFFVAGWALEIVSAIIGILGVITTQLATVLDRASELRTLRTIGVPDRSITTSLALECGLLGMLGGIVAVAISAIVGAEGVLGTFRIMAGWRLRVAWPVSSMVAAIVLATLVSAVAGLVPARAAARLELGVGGIE